MTKKKILSSKEGFKELPKEKKKKKNKKEKEKFSLTDGIMSILLLFLSLLSIVVVILTKNYVLALSFMMIFLIYPCVRMILAETVRSVQYHATYLVWASICIFISIYFELEGYLLLMSSSLGISTIMVLYYAIRSFKILGDDK